MATTLETFIIECPEQNPAKSNITGVVCGVRAEDIEDHIMKIIRYLS